MSERELGVPEDRDLEISTERKGRNHLEKKKKVKAKKRKTMLWGW